MRWLLLTLICLLLAGCGSAGDFCEQDSDCPMGLVCSASGAKRGVCTYRKKPKQDAGAKQDSAPLPDAKPASEAGADSATAAPDTGSGSDATAGG